MARLRRSRFDGIAIERRRCVRGFSYRWTTGERVTDPSVIERNGLAIPPARADVWICPWPPGHIQAVGIDAAGRRQYRYHGEWRRQRDVENFSRMTTFASALPEIRATVAHDLNQSGLGRSRVVARGVRLLDIGMFRVGGEEYAETREAYGLATLEKRHVKLRSGTAIFDYSAKGGAQRLLEVADPGAVAAIAALRRRRGGAELLPWREGAHRVDVRSHDINAYLKEVSGGPFTAKDFRTWDASLLAAVLCAQATPPIAIQFCTIAFRTAETSGRDLGREKEGGVRSEPGDMSMSDSR